ncbi:hypothetical protein FIBSPDRAFT_362480 [Athelia psychrophila]|uniref:Uncharacterized protein n=1 Tax=Athelia psychrophila TaxID=1759441 RepID=A0A166PDD1_9AGAM|nr:hypothetical protein FIBSPDRAFT_362480 [Fibularhizoctonia sp. CBS 109695]
MANTSCSFPSINDLLAQAEAGQANITAVVSTCQGICSITWGAGDPDLSGVGLIICYVFQAVLTIIFGPLFCAFYHRFHKNFSDDKNKKLEELHDTFLDTIALFSVPVAVATVMRLHYNPPIYEMDFMHSLTTMQFFSLLATAVTAGILGRSDRSEKYKSALRITVICLYGLFEFGFYMGLVGGLRTSAARWEAIDQLGNACQAYGTLLPGFEAIKKLRWLLPHVNWSSYFKELFEFKPKFKIGLIITGFVLAGIVCLGIVVVLVGLVGYIFKKKLILPIGAMSLGLSIGMR